MAFGHIGTGPPFHDEGGADGVPARLAVKGPDAVLIAKRPRGPLDPATSRRRPDASWRQT